MEEGRISGPQEGLVGEVTFTDTGDTIRFEADVPEEANWEGDLEGFDPEQVEGLLTYDARIRVTFPGEVIEHNGELVENTVTWAFDDPASMAGAELFAEAKKGSSSVVLYLVAAVLGLGVIALVVWQVLRRRTPPTVDEARSTVPSSWRIRSSRRRSSPFSPATSRRSTSARPRPVRDFSRPDGPQPGNGLRRGGGGRSRNRRPSRR